MGSFTFGSLFTGIGGMDLGLERAGMRPIWMVENDPYCRKVLKKHWPEVTLYDDIKEIDWAEVERPDLVCGGFPCPVVSQAARGRNTGEWLWPQFARAISHIQPDYALVENVPGLLRARIREVVGDLASLGYVSEWQTLPASQFGAPHLRSRLWLVAHPYGKGKPYGPFYAEASWVQELHATVWKWPDPPRGIRMDDGLPNRSHRLKALGNAVVPQVAEWIGRRIMDSQPAP